MGEQCKRPQNLSFLKPLGPLNVPSFLPPLYSRHAPSLTLKVTEMEDIPLSPPLRRLRFSMRAA